MFIQLKSLTSLLTLGKISDDEKFREIFQTVVDTFIDAKEYGSILNVPDADYDYALSVIDDFEQSVPVDLRLKFSVAKPMIFVRLLIKQSCCHKSMMW